MPPGISLYIFIYKLVQYVGFCRMLLGVNFQLCGHRGEECRMLFIEFHRQRGLSEFSEITSAKYFDLAFVIILLHRWHLCL